MNNRLLASLVCLSCCSTTFAANSLQVISQPSSISAQTFFQVQVAVKNEQGQVDTSFNGDISLDVGPGSPLGATLHSEEVLGTILHGQQVVTAVNGVATFQSLLLDRGGDVHLQATQASMSPTTASVHVTSAMRISFEAQDTTSGHQPLAPSSLHPGDTFDLAAYVQDVRSPAMFSSGVFAAWLNVLYNDLASITPGGALSNRPDTAIRFSPLFPLVPSGDLNTPGLIRDVGAAVIATPQTTNRQLLFRVLVHANQAGTLTFSSQFDVAPPQLGHDLFLAHPVVPLTEDQIDFGQLTLTIVPEPSTLALAVLGIAGLAFLGRRRRNR